jgi:hypothetical protein
MHTVFAKENFSQWLIYVSLQKTAPGMLLTDAVLGN